MLNFGGEAEKAAFELVMKLRNQGFRIDMYPSAAKMQKQLKYADKRNVPAVVFLGAEELEKREFIVKNMSSGEQSVGSLDNITATFQ